MPAGTALPAAVLDLTQQYRELIAAGHGGGRSLRRSVTPHEVGGTSAADSAASCCRKPTTSGRLSSRFGSSLSAAVGVGAAGRLAGYWPPGSWFTVWAETEPRPLRPVRRAPEAASPDGGTRGPPVQCDTPGLAPSGPGDEAVERHGGGAARGLFQVEVPRRQRERPAGVRAIPVTLPRPFAVEAAARRGADRYRKGHRRSSG